MSESGTCPKCSKPKVQSTHGSITQWMSSCSCDLVDSTAPTTDIAVTTFLCKTCGKRIDAGRAGSLTQWIFRSDKCECEVPQLVEEVLTPVTAEPDAKAESSDDESGMELDPSVFPTDRYMASREIGKGAAGQVFLCKDKLLKTKVAVKCLRHLTPEQLIGFQQEARATSKLSHPSIIKVLNFGITDGGAPYMVMDFFDGISLEKYLERSGPLEAVDAMSIIAQTADALAYAHSKGVLHRDIKSSNILIEGDRACLIDFGIAMVKQAHQEPTIVQGRTVAGTPAYMPPDQANGLTYDERSEIYSLGCVLFEALAGEPPFAGETALEIISKHATQIAPPINEINPGADCTDEIESIIARCLAKLPENRFRTMNELRDACDSTGSLASGESGFADNDVQQNGNELPSSDLERQKRASGTRLVVAVIAAVAGLTIVSTWLIMSHSSQEESRPIRPISPGHEILSVNRGEAMKSMIQNGGTDFRLGVLWPDCTDDDLAVFDDNKIATAIDCTDMEISDAALKHFSSLPLKRLVLSGTKVNTLQFVPGAKTLTALHVDGTAVNDAALGRLSNFQRLDAIFLEGTDVTADGIIKALSNVPLQEMRIQSCPNITQADVERIRMAFPSTRIGDRGSALEEAEYADSTDDGRSCLEKWKKWRDFSKSHPDPRKRIAVGSLCNMAKNALRIGKMNLAKNYLDEALVIGTHSGFPLNVRIVQEALFDYYVRNKDIEPAIKIGMKALDFDREFIGSVKFGMAYKVSECLMSKGRYLEALENLEQTESARNEWVTRMAELTAANRHSEIELKIERQEQIYHQLRLAHCLVALHRGEKSITKSNNALRIVRENGIADPVVIADVFAMKANGEAECKRYQKALESNEQAIIASRGSKTQRGKEQYAAALKQKQAILRSQKDNG